MYPVGWTERQSCAGLLLYSFGHQRTTIEDNVFDVAMQYELLWGKSVLSSSLIAFNFHEPLCANWCLVLLLVNFDQVVHFMVIIFLRWTQIARGVLIHGVQAVLDSCIVCQVC